MNKHFDDQETRDWFRGILKETLVEVVFTKADGTERIMHCTLNANVIPQPDTDDSKPKKVIKESPDVIRVWDTDKSGWRSFRWDSIKSFTFS